MHMKVAMMVDSHYPVKDGVVDAIDALRKGLQERGHEVLMIAPDPGEEHRLEGVHYIPAKHFDTFEGYHLPIFPSDSIFKLKETDVDVINVHGFAFNAVRGVASAKILRKPVVVTFHTPVWNFIADYSPVHPEFALNVGWAYFRRLFKRTDFTVAQMPSIAKELTDNGVKADIRVIPTGIDTERFRPGTDGSMIRERHGTAGKKVAIHVGRLCPEKCLDVLIKAFAGIDGAVLMLVGKGESEKELKELTRSLGMSDRVIFTGFVSDEELPLYYAAADLGVSSSIYEAQCLAIMNAMSCGLPVACPSGRAFSDFIEDGVNGFLYDASPEGCADAVRRCLSADASVGSNARRTAEEHSVPKWIDRYISLYEEAIEKKRKG
jgi:1,2-diacylglycerol 3-alpha-glucosyltransferase